MTSYGDIHRRFLQSFVYHPVQTESEVEEVHKLVCEEQGKEISQPTDELINTINTTIRNHTTLQIKSGVCELTGKKYYIAANCDTFKWTKTISPYTKNEQLLFKKILDEILRAEDGNISVIVCLNAFQNNMSKTDVNTSIKKFVTDGWFTEKKGHLYVGVRGAAELEPHICEAYADIASHCPLCKKLIFWGHRCGICSKTTHIHCLRKYFKSTGVNAACPSCEAQWNNWGDEYQSSEESE